MSTSARGRRNSTKEDERPIAVIDCETDPFMRLRKPRPFLWGFYDGERYLCFLTAEALIAFLKDKRYVIYAHNGGKFDYQYLIDYMEPYTEVLIINGRLAKFAIGDCEFRDSWNILPEKLASFKIGSLKKLDIDYAKLEEKVRHLHMDEIKRYLEADCRTLYAAVKAFIDTYGKALTLAGAAMKVWQGMINFEVPHSNSWFYECNKDYYYGGRVQCFESGIIEKPFYFTDINSAYPFAMLHDHPLSVHPETIKSKFGDEIIKQSMYFINGVSRGALPWRPTCDGELSFPQDQLPRDYCVTGWELQAALDTNALRINKIHSRTDFPTECNFKEYVMKFYEQKKKAEKGSTEYVFAKLMMNSLYGKFAANPENYCNYGIVPSDQAEPVEMDRSLVLGRNTGPWTFTGTIGPWAVMAGKDPKTGKGNGVHSKYFNVATAASITGFVRSYLWRHIHAIRQGGGSMLYCDTDSLAFTYPGPKEGLPFKLSKELGDWTLEGTFSRGGIAGKKMYAFYMDDATYAPLEAKAKEKGDEPPKRWKTASKGVKFNHDEIMTVADGGVLTYLSPVDTFSPVRKGKNAGKTYFMHRTVKATAKTK